MTKIDSKKNVQKKPAQKKIKKKVQENMFEEEVLVQEEVIIYDSFLENRIVDIKAIESSGKWKNLLAGGQDLKKEPYMFKKVKKSFQVPLNSARKGGGIKIILDNIERKTIKKYEDKYPNGITEQQFFEEELGIDLNPALPKDENFWRKDKRGRVTLTREGMSLNLAESMGMLRFKILLSNKTLIAPSYDERRGRGTYEFMVVNEGKLTSRRVEEAKQKSDAFAEYTKVTASLIQMKGFIKAIGRTIPANYNEDWLKAEILDVLEASASKFLLIVKDPTYNAKIFVQEAVETGAIKRMNDRRYVLDNGVELGDLHHTIQWFNNPEHQETKMRVKSQINMATNR